MIIIITKTIIIVIILYYYIIIEYQKIKNSLGDSKNQPSKSRTKNWVEINEESKGRCIISTIRFKTSMIKSSSSDYGDAYIFLKGTIAVANKTASGAAVNNTNKKVIFKFCAPFTDCITDINNTQVHDAKKMI